MPRVTPQSELDRLFGLISAHPEGIGAEAIAQLMANGLPRR